MSKKTEFYDNVTVGVLCGGSGTRLWPLSTERVPKPFHKLSDKNHTLFKVQRANNSSTVVYKDNFDLAYHNIRKVLAVKWVPLD